MRRIVINSIIFASITLFLGNCSRSAPTKECPEGFYCYKHINFGKSRGKSYERGIRDGCRTGEGFFTKDYESSRTDKDYYDGWILGRSKCHQILPNEGTRLEEEKSRQRAEYQIRQMKIEQESQPEEENIVDAIMDSDESEQIQESEY